MPAKPIKFARVRQKFSKYRSKCPTCFSNVVFVKCANRSNHGRLSVLFFLPYITKRLIDSEYRNRVRPKRQDKHRNGTKRLLYIHYSDIFVNSHAILGYIMLELLKQNFETKFDIPNFLCFIHMYTAYKVVCKNCNFLYRVTTELTTGIGQGAQAPPFQKWGDGGTSGFVLPPPPLLDRGNVRNSLFWDPHFAHILWLKTHFF